MDKCNQATDKELMEAALKHYDEISTAAHHWSSVVPDAIRHYFNSRWISVKDRLPKHQEYCLYWVRMGEYAETGFYGYGEDWDENDAVTHWMPVPEPPKE